MPQELLTDAEIGSRLDGSEWRRDGNEIVRDLTLRDFDDAIALVNRIAAVAQRHDHHPDILVHGWNKVRLSLTNHSAGGLTGTDFEMASRFDEVV